MRRGWWWTVLRARSWFRFELQNPRKIENDMPRDPESEEPLARRRVPQQPRAQDRVDRILEIAETLMQRESIASITASALAAGAEIPIGSFYQYFPNKLAVFAELARRAMERVDAELFALITEVNLDNWEDIVRGRM